MNYKKLILASSALMSSLAFAGLPNEHMRDLIPSSYDTTFLTSTVVVENEEFRATMPITIALWEESGVTKSLVGASDSTEDAATFSFYTCNTSPTITAAYKSATNVDAFSYSCGSLSKVSTLNGTNEMVFGGIHPISFKGLTLSFERPKGKMLSSSSGAISQRFKVYERTSGAMNGSLTYRNANSVTKTASMTPLNLVEEYNYTAGARTQLKSSIENLGTGTSTFYADINLPNGDDLIYDVATLKQKYEIAISANHVNGYSMPLFNFYTASTSTTLDNLKLILPYSFPSGYFTVTVNIKEKATGKQYVDHYTGHKN